ncbi:MAG: hypothetical protein ACHQAZ_00445 [Gammaproteobacteria bacterium]
MKRSPQNTPGDRPSRALDASRLVGTLCLLCVSLVWSLSTAAQDAAPQYPAMTPVAQYASASQAAEIALAKSAAPASISDHADVMVLGAHGYEKVAKGDNGFVCLVGRSWAMAFDNPEFWNPKIRTPICLNAMSARSVSVLPSYLTRTQWVLAGVSVAEMHDRETAEWKDGRLKPPDPNCVTFMMSKDQYINDSAHPWHPHVMIFAPRITDTELGANIHGSPVAADSTNVEQTSIFMVVVAKWSDGTLDASQQQVSKPGEPHHH